MKKARQDRQKALKQRRRPVAGGASGCKKQDKLDTAAAFLQKLVHLRIVIFQDAATIKIKHPARFNHGVFHHPAFMCNEFNKFVELMRSEFDREGESERATIEDALPGVSRRFDQVQDDVREIKKGNLRIESKLDFQQHMLNAFHSAFTAATATLTSCKGEDSNALHGIGAQSFGQSNCCQPNHGNGENVDVEHARKYRIPRGLSSVAEMVDCWNGTGKFAQDGPLGGFSALEKAYKNKWRNHFSDSDAQYFSRMKRIVGAASSSERIDKMDKFWKENRSHEGLVVFCQNSGWLPRNKRNSKTSNTTE